MPCCGPATLRYKYRSLGSSRFARHYSGNRWALSFPPLTEMFHFSGSGSHGPIVFSPPDPDITRDGFPHSEIHGSKRACRSPWLIATYYVLHRLLSPRHPPCALCSLITNFRLAFSLLQRNQTEYSQHCCSLITTTCMQLSKNPPAAFSRRRNHPTGLPSRSTLAPRLSCEVK